MKLANLVVRRRGWIGLAWLVAAVVCVPRARRLPDVLQTSARVEGSESAVIEQLLRGPLASAYSRYAVLVVQGVPTPQTSAGAAALHRIVEPLASARPVAGVFSYLDQPDSLLVSLEDSSTLVIVGLVADSANRPDRIIQDLRSITGRLADTLRRDYPAVALRWTGDTPLNVDLRRTSATDVQRAERRALPVTAVLRVLSCC